MIVTYHNKELKISFHEVFLNFGGQLPGYPPFSGVAGVYKQKIAAHAPKIRLIKLRA